MLIVFLGLLEIPCDQVPIFGKVELTRAQDSTRLLVEYDKRMGLRARDGYIFCHGLKP